MALRYYICYVFLSSPVPNKQKKKKVPVVVVETIIFKLNAKLDQVEVKFVSELHEISLCAIKGVATEIIVKKPYTQIKAILLDLVVSDLNPKSVHKKV